MMDYRNLSIRSLPLERINYSAISGNCNWYGDLRYFTKNVLFTVLEGSIAQISLALQKSALFLAIIIQIQ